MVITSADDVDAMVYDQLIVLSEPCQTMSNHTTQPQPPAPAPRPQTPVPRPWPRTQETHPLSGWEHLELSTPQKPYLAVPTLPEADAAGNTSDGDLDQQRLIKSAGSDSLPNVPLPNVPLSDICLADVPLSDITLPDIPLPEPRLVVSVGKEWTSPHDAEEVMVVEFRSGSGCCLCLFPLF